MEEVLEAIACRESQIRQLVQLLCTDLPLNTLVIHGLEATGKSLTTQRVLETCTKQFALIPSRQCITTRHLLERTLSEVQAALRGRGAQQKGGTETNVRCEGISVFSTQLQRLLAGREKFVIVFDGIDRQREAVPTLLPALAILGEKIPNLTTVFIITTPHPSLFHRAGVPHIHFPQYTRTEILAIIGQEPVTIHESHPEDTPPSSDVDPDSIWLWTRFTTAVYDSLGQSAARDIPTFRSACHRLWRPFVQLIVEDQYGAREFSKLMIKNRHLFQSETALSETIVPLPSSLLKPPSSQQPRQSFTATPTPIKPPHYTAHLLLAAYLASHNPPRSDMMLFSKILQGKRRRKRSGAAAAAAAATKPATSAAASKAAQRQHYRRLLGPQAFTLERLLAIYHALLAEDWYRGGDAEVMGQFTTLVALRLVTRAGLGGGGVAAGAGMGEVLAGAGKWKCGIGWETIRPVAVGCGIVLEDYLAEK